MYLKNNLSNVRSSQIKRAAETKAGSPTWALNLSYPEWEGIKALYSHIFAFYSSLVIPGIPQRFTSPSCSATFWLQGWVASWLADLASEPLIADEGPSKSQTSNSYRHNTSHQAAFQTTTAFIALQLQCTSLTKIDYSLSTRALYLQQTPTLKYNWRWSSCKSVQLAFPASITWSSSEMERLQHWFYFWSFKIILFNHIIDLKLWMQLFISSFSIFHCCSIDFWQKENKQLQTWWNAPTACNFNCWSALSSDKL